MNISPSLEELPVDDRGHKIVQLDSIVQLVRLGESLRYQGNAVLVDRENLKLYVWRIESTD